MSVNNLFLKTDNAGRRQPTILTYGLVGALVFCSYFLSQNKKPVKTKNAKESIIKEKDIIEAANNSLSDEGKGFKLDFPQVVTPPTLKEVSQVYLSPPKPLVVMTTALNTKMIVFDNTKDYQSGWIVPLGSMVKCLLIHNIVTNNFEAPVIVQVWEDFYFDGKLLLPFGTRIYGTASAGKQRDRVMVRFDNIVFQNGKTLKVNAIGLSRDGSGGLTGTVINESNKKTFIAMALNFLSGTASGLQQTSTNAVTGMSEVEASSRNALLNGVANTFQNEAKSVKEEADNAKGYAIVLAGSQLVVYFEKEIDTQGR